MPTEDLYGEEYFETRQGNDPKRLASFVQEARLISRHVSLDGRVLDVGCSTGEFLIAVGWRGPMYGMEVSRHAILAAKSKGISFEKGLFNTEEWFDLIVFRGTIQHIDTPFLYLKQAYAALKPGGHVAFLATPNSNSFYYRKWKTLPFLDPPRNFYIPSDVQLVDCMRNFGFELAEIEYPYLTSPYARPILDHVMCLLKLLGFSVKFPFWRSSMNAVFRKPAVRGGAAPA